MQNNQHHTIKAAGKIILLGEHSVVYGAPAFALPLKTAVEARYIKRKDNQFKIFSSREKISDPLVNKALAKLGSLSNCKGFELTITKNKLPLSSGLGSSAALSFLLAKAAFLSEGEPSPPLEILHKRTHELEKIFHEKPSGIDDTVVCHRKPVIFQKGGYSNSALLEGDFFTGEIFFPRLHLPPLLNFSICHSNTSAVTGKMIKFLKQRLNSQTALEDFKNQMETIFHNAVFDWKSHNFAEFGKKLTKVHSFYNNLGISTPQLNEIVNTALNFGALGAKLSGSGGGGCALILHENQFYQPIKNNLEKKGYKLLKLTPSFK